MNKYRALLFLALLKISPLQAEGYMTPMLESRWLLEKSAKQCLLTHRIPYFGQADFSIRSDRPLQFILREEPSRTSIVRASLVVDNPGWLHSPRDERVFQVYKENAPEGLAVYGNVAEVMLDALSSGLSPTFIFTRGSLQGHGADTKVAVSPINFTGVFQEFLQCRQRFPRVVKTAAVKGKKFDFDALRQLYFPVGKAALDSDSKTKLNVVARFLTGTDWKGRLVISGHSDGRGNRRRNQRLSLERAQAVKEYLTQRGIEPERISVRAFGESKPAVRNRREGGHSRNRRVQIDWVAGL